jgi:hypothetical protein
VSGPVRAGGGLHRPGSAHHGSMYDATTSAETVAPLLRGRIDYEVSWTNEYLEGTFVARPEPSLGSRNRVAVRRKSVPGSRNCVPASRDASPVTLHACPARRIRTLPIDFGPCRPAPEPWRRASERC